MATTLRHEFYENDERLTLSIFDKGADPEQVKIEFEPRKFTYTNGEKNLVLEPLKGQIDPTKSDFTVGRVKIEVRLHKLVLGRWSGLIGDAPDPLAAFPAQAETTSIKPKAHKNWDGGDSTLNSFFQKIYGDADDDTKRAMLKSYTESGGTTLSTNWGEVGRDKVTVKPPQGSEWKTWG
ncbi:SGS-domain-containing protein [Flagelloscypha sp. PMI_526]|nr:SGS-domain-containing protein [Flagelloscypha sp. PMI_526]